MTRDLVSQSEKRAPNRSPSVLVLSAPSTMQDTLITVRQILNAYVNHWSGLSTKSGSSYTLKMLIFCDSAKHEVFASKP
jgi:hypothetical protein